MSTRDAGENQPPFTQEDYGCYAGTYQLLDKLWPQITEIVRKILNTDNLTLYDVQKYLVSLRTPNPSKATYRDSMGNPVIPLPYENREMNKIVSQATVLKSSQAYNHKTHLPQDEKVIYLPQVTKEPESLLVPVDTKPKLESKEDKCAYYQANPDKYLFYLKESKIREVPLFTLLHLVPIFRIVSRLERKSLTLPNDVDKNRDKPEIVKSSNGQYEVKGPVLCTQDLLVFYALMYIYASDKTEGLSISTDYSQLYKVLNPKISYQLGADNKKSLKRSLIRLSICSIKKPDSGKHLKGFDGALINVNAINPTRTKKLEIQFNKNFINHFIYNSFTKVDFDILLTLNAHELKLYSYLLVRGFKSGIDYKISTIFDCIYSKQNEVNQKVKLTRVGEAIKGLIQKGLLQPQSGLIKSPSFSKESHYLLNLV